MRFKNKDKPRGKDLKGQKFGRLTPIEQVKDDKWGRIQWSFKCECGKTIERYYGDVMTGRIKSCGCLNDELNQARVLPNGQAMFNAVYLTYKSNAKSRNLPFELNKEQARDFFEQNCTYCGCPPSMVKFCAKKKRSIPFTYNGIDRLDSSQGYIEGNCVTACFNCNWSKQTRTPEEFLDWIKKVYRHSCEK